MMQTLDEFLTVVQQRNPHQPEYIQSICEVMTSVWPFLQDQPEYTEQALLARLVEPERIIQFRVTWVDDNEQVQVNRGYRIQHSQSLGPYKGGLRFHPSVNQSILQFLAFEQTFKNALTGLPLGSAKGGADFDPRGRSDTEVMRFCQAFILALHRHIGNDVDVPAGDIGVGGREIGYMTGMMKKITGSTATTLTGKGLSYGGSLMRTEATGYGLVYFVQHMLKRIDVDFKDKIVVVSGSGNVAIHAIERAMMDGACVVSASDSDGTVYDPEGFDANKLAKLKDIKLKQRGRIKDYAEALKLDYQAGKAPWHIKADIVLPCATQNELDGAAAKAIIKHKTLCVAEGANMPCTTEAIAAFQNAKILYAPGKASNAGGVATSGLEMSQNAQKLVWTQDEVDQKLREIMQKIHDDCVDNGKQARDDTVGMPHVDYLKGANLAGFKRVAEAMIAQGVL